MLPLHDVKLTPYERRRLIDVTRRGTARARVLTRARMLLLVDEGCGRDAVARLFGVQRGTLRNIITRYNEEGLDGILQDHPRSGRPVEITPPERERVVALACGPPPPGRARWTVRLLADESRKRGFVTHAGRESIRTILKHHALAPWREKNVVRSRPHSEVHREDERRSRSLRASLPTK